VVSANLLVADTPLPLPDTLDARAFNVGTGVETSVNELARTMMEAAGTQVPVHHADARPGELLHSCLDASRLRALGWAPAVTLHQGLEATYRHITGQEASA
jgi:UDP-glucose 4-epimerase